MSQFLSYHEWYRHGPLAAVPQVDRVIQAGPVHVINVSPPAGDVVEPPVPEYGLHLLLRTAPLLRVGFNRRPRWLAVSPGSMVLAPPDTACQYVGDAAAHVISVAMPKACVEEFAEDAGVRVEVRDEEAFRDPRLVRQLIALWHELDDDVPGSGMLADQVTRALLETIVRRGGGREMIAKYQRLGRERLAYHTLRRLCDYVESSLADDLDVPMLAEVAALSPAHFARAFAATVGMTPFEYVMTRRLTRAHQLLQDTRRPALDIAFDVGFKTPSHFTTRFRREFGVTPRAIRGDAGSRAFAIMSPQPAR